MYRFDVFTVNPALAGLPAVSIPVGFDSQNLSVGCQLIGKSLEEKNPFRVCYDLEPLVPISEAEKVIGLESD